MYETLRNVLYLLAQAILWGCIVLDIRGYRQSKRLCEEYRKAIISANEAREKYLQGCEVNAQIQDELIRDKEYFHNLRQQQEVQNAT